MVDQQKYEVNLFGWEINPRRFLYYCAGITAFCVAATIGTIYYSFSSLSMHQEERQKEIQQIQKLVNDIDKLQKTLVNDISLFVEESQEIRGKIEDLEEGLRIFDDDMRQLNETLRRHPLYAPEGIERRM